jgi:hypothetical protein
MVRTLREADTLQKFGRPAARLSVDAAKLRGKQDVFFRG